MVSMATVKSVRKCQTDNKKQMYTLHKIIIYYLRNDHAHCSCQYTNFKNIVCIYSYYLSHIIRTTVQLAVSL